MRAPERLETDRLLIRRPTLGDAKAIFATYASDPEVTRYVGWPRHARVGDTRGFLEFSNMQWHKWPAGPYVMLLRDSETLIGSTGLMFETPARAATGYVLAKSAWGRGYATEALAAIVQVAAGCGVCRLYALCHHAHRASARVLEKNGFALEGTLRRYAEFPNLSPGLLSDVLCYSAILEDRREAPPFEMNAGTEGKMRS